MARSITISDVVGTTSAENLVSIQVTGTATECDQVDVSISGGEATGAAVHQSAFNMAGTWTAIFGATDIQAAKCFSQQPITVSATCVDPNDPQCFATKTVPQLVSGPPCCNVQITATVSAMCDKIRDVTFVVQNSCSSTVNALLDFGKGSAPSAVSLLPGATQTFHSPYTPGTYTAILQIPGCADKPVTFVVLPCTGACCLPDGSCQDGLTKTQCENRGGTYMGDGHLCANTRCPSGTGPDPCTTTFRAWLCPLLLVAMTFSTALGLAFILLSSCSGPFAAVANYLVTIGAFLCAIGGGALILYWIFCSKCLCGWFYLFLWRVLFGVGLLITVFSQCCSNLIGPGLLLMALGILFLFLWQKRCNKTLCELLQEVIFVMAVYLLPLISLILGLGNGGVSSCLWVLFSFGSFNFTFLALVSVIFGLIVAYEQNNC